MAPSLPTLRRDQRPRHRWRWVLIALAGIAAIVLAVALFRRGAQPVEADTVARGVVTVTIDAEGTTRIVHRHAMVAPVAGALERIAVRAGDAVKTGDVLARISPSASVLFDARSASQAEERVGASRALLAQARTALTRAELSRTQSERDLTRTRSLAAAGAISRQQLEQAELLDAQREADVSAAQSAVRVAEHELLAARAAVSGGARVAELSSTVVKAPMDGVVLRVLQEDEGVVGAGTPLLEIGDLTSMEVLTDVLSEDAARLRPNAPATIAIGADAVRAKVARIEPQAFTKRSSLGVDEQRVRLVLVTTQPTDAMLRLGDGFRVDVALETARTEDSVVTVPAGALLRQGQGWSVYTIRDGAARLTPVTIGLRSATMAEVQSGLTPGDRVILFPSDQVRDGGRVTLRTARAVSAK
jgi:HlyD family secretion protein